MGIFSDDNINEAERLILSIRGLTKNQQWAFIEGFKDGYEEIKNTDKDIKPVSRLVKKALSVGYSQEDLEKIYSEQDLGALEEFGFRFGVLIGLLVNHPTFVIDNAIVNLIVQYINSLKEIPEYFALVNGKIKLWKGKMTSEMLSRMPETAGRRYAYFIENI